MIESLLKCECCDQHVSLCRCREESQGKLRALVVDDDPLIRELVVDLLASWGYETRTAENGKEALCHFHKQAVDLVITDYRMPGMSGIELASMIRMESSGANVKIIMISGDDPYDIAVAAQQAGVDAFLQKPFRTKALRTAIGIFLA